jgi:hypothetical protein
METLLTSLTSVVTSVIAWGGQVVGFITSNPLVLAYVGMGIFGMAVVLVKSFIHR